MTATAMRQEALSGDIMSALTPTEYAAAMERLGRLKNRGTAYELALVNGETRYLFAYMDRRTRRAVYDITVKRLPHLQRILGAEEPIITFTPRQPDGVGKVASIDAWELVWTGRTQREAIFSPLPFVAKVASC